MVRSLGTDQLPVAQELIEDLAEKLPLQRLLFLAEQMAIGDAGSPAESYRPMSPIRRGGQFPQGVGQQAAVEQRFQVVGHGHPVSAQFSQQTERITKFVNSSCRSN